MSPPVSLTDEERANKRLLADFFASGLFKWLLGGVGTVVILLLVVGWNSYLDGQVSKNQDVRDSKAALTSISKAIQIHTTQLDEAAVDRKTNSEVQVEMFKAIKGIRDDIHGLDTKISVVNQKVDDLKEQLPKSK